MECPKCKTTLAESATYCGCGWKAPRTKDAPIQHINCAYADCLKPAIMRERTATGWSNLCHHHMTRHHHDRAEKYCASRGLMTTGQKRAYALNLLKRRIPELQSEPGCNTEPLTHAINRVRELADDLPW